MFMFRGYSKSLGGPRIPLDTMFKVLHQIVPDNIKVKRKVDIRTLRSNNDNTGTMIESNETTKTFQKEAKMVFNSLPKTIRDCKEINVFKNKIKKYLLDKALARVM